MTASLVRPRSVATSGWRRARHRSLFPAGEASAGITLTPLLDANLESDELITLEILHSPSYAIGLPFIADGTIRGECDDILLNGDLDPTFGEAMGWQPRTLTTRIERHHCHGACTRWKVLRRRAVGGATTTHVIARFRTNGLPDPSFGRAGLVVTPLSDLGRSAHQDRGTIRWQGHCGGQHFFHKCQFWHGAIPSRRVFRHHVRWGRRDRRNGFW